MVLERPVVGEAALAAKLAGRYTLVKARPEVLVIDCNSVQGGVMDTIARSRAVGARVLVLSSSTDRFLVASLLRAGVEGLVTRLMTWSDLFTAIESIAAGRRVYGPEIAEIFAQTHAIDMQVVDGQSWELDPVKSSQTSSQTSSQDNAPMALSRREAQILQLVATGRSNAAIGAALCISAHTVRKHRENLMAKLDLHNVAEVTAFAVRHKLLDPTRADAAERAGSEKLPAPGRPSRSRFMREAA